MPIFQYKCHNCSSVFEYLVAATTRIDCVACGASDVSRADASYFYPNKTFCPHDKELDSEYLKTKLGGIMSDQKERCGGCGTDGAPGKCKEGGCGSGGGCGGGGCGSGGCGGRGGGRGSGCGTGG